MDTQPDVDTSQAPSDVTTPSLDPLRRVFVPREAKTSKGTIVFRTFDGTLYARLENGSIRRAHPKVNGKVARKMRRSALKK